MHPRQNLTPAERIRRRKSQERWSRSALDRNQQHAICRMEFAVSEASLFGSRLCPCDRGGRPGVANLARWNKQADRPQGD
jgi:hypothetical protein